MMAVTNPTPHNWEGHIKHQMWWTTFDAGNPHVRFDERDLETGEMASYSDTGNRKGREHVMIQPNSTAPDLDSTIETADSADFTGIEGVIGDKRTKLFVANLQSIYNSNLLYPCNPRNLRLI